MTPSLLRAYSLADGREPDGSTLRAVTLAGEVLRAPAQFRRWHAAVGSAARTTCTVRPRCPARAPAASASRTTSILRSAGPLPSPTSRQGHVLGREGEELPSGVPGELYMALSVQGEPWLLSAQPAPDRGVRISTRTRWNRGGGCTGPATGWRCGPTGNWTSSAGSTTRSRVAGNRIEPDEVRALLGDSRPCGRPRSRPEGTPSRLVALRHGPDPGRARRRGPSWSKPLLRGCRCRRSCRREVYALDEIPLDGNDKTDFAGAGHMRASPLPAAAPGPESSPADRSDGRPRSWPAVLGEHLDVDAGGELLRAGRPFAAGGDVVRRRSAGTASRSGRETSWPTPRSAAWPGCWPEPPNQPPSACAHHRGEHPATSVQQRLWFLDRIPELRAAYLVPAVVELADVDTAKLRQAVDDGARRATPRCAPGSGWTGRPARSSIARTERPGTQSSPTPGHGGRPRCPTTSPRCAGPRSTSAVDAPARAEIIVRRERCLLVVCAHHIVVDGRSQQILLDQVARSYRGEPLPEPVHPARIPEPVGAGLAELVAALGRRTTDVRLPHDRPRGATQTIERERRSARPSVPGSPLGSVLWRRKPGAPRS